MRPDQVNRSDIVREREREREKGLNKGEHEPPLILPLPVDCSIQLENVVDDDGDDYGHTSFTLGQHLISI